MSVKNKFSHSKHDFQANPCIRAMRSCADSFPFSSSPKVLRMLAQMMSDCVETNIAVNFRCPLIVKKLEKTHDHSHTLPTLHTPSQHILAHPSPLQPQVPLAHSLRTHIVHRPDHRPEYEGGRRPRGVGINCLVKPNGEAWHNEFLVSPYLISSRNWK